MFLCQEKIENWQTITIFSDPEGTRTLNPQNRNLILYPIELRDQREF
jgi:hypothetical protein